MKKYLALLLALAMVICCLTACGSETETTPDASEPVPEVTEPAEPASEEAAESAEGTVIELGKSGLTITVEKTYVEGEITTEDTDEGQVAYYRSEDSLVDFDVYEWAKADGETLEAAAAEEAAEYEAEARLIEINGFNAALYNAVEENGGVEYTTATYIIDNGDEFVEIVFWLDGETAEAEVEAILSTLA